MGIGPRGRGVLRCRLIYAEKANCRRRSVFRVGVTSEGRTEHVVVLLSTFEAGIRRLGSEESFISDCRLCLSLRPRRDASIKVIQDNQGLRF